MSLPHMPSEPPPSTPVFRCPVAYEDSAASLKNPDLTGLGEFRFESDPRTIVFAGQRRLLFSRDPIELPFRPDEIWNVIVEGRAVMFHTSRGAAGEKSRPFVFFCRDEPTAQTVAGYLPTGLDPDYVAVRDFRTRLDELDGAKSPLTSVSNVLIALNVAGFVVMGLLGAGWIQPESMTPYILYGANQGAATTSGEWWRLLTSMFVHYGILHLALNMWALFQAGPFLERLQGRALFALTYLGSGLAGGFASIAWNGDKSWSAGASGAVFGVFGAIIGFLWREKQSLPKTLYQSLLRSSLTFAGFNILFGITRPGIDNAAHLGGFAGGLLMGWLVALPVDREVRRQRTGGRVRVALVALGVIIVAGVALTPRFDYTVEDRLAWEEVNESMQPRERSLIEHNAHALTEVQAGAAPAPYVAWLEAELIPFYDGWVRQLNALALTPGKETARRRTDFVRVLTIQRSLYERLASDLRTGAPDVALEKFATGEKQVAAAIAQLKPH